MKRNIFHGNDDLMRLANKTLNLGDGVSRRASEKIYHQAYFYLSERFGPHFEHDEYKIAGVWQFKVKDYVIEVVICSIWVTFIVYGDPRSAVGVTSPYHVKYNRQLRERDHLIAKFYKDERTEQENHIISEQLTAFIAHNDIDPNIPQEEFNEKHLSAFVDWLIEYNEGLVDLDYHETTSRYGDTHSNSRSRHALRTLEQFLKNMLVPYYIRDVPYNITGRISYEDANMYNNRYDGNVKIEYIKR